MGLLSTNTFPSWSCSNNIFLTSFHTAPILALRNNPRILKLPPYLSLLCIVIGLAWLLVLPLNEYSRRTYISENALLPGQVHTYFGGSEHNVFRAYRHEVAALAQEPGEKLVLHQIMFTCSSV